MTVDKNTIQETPFNAFEALKDRLLYGVSQDELSTKTEELIRTSLYLKAASFCKAPNKEFIEIPKQWRWSEAHHFLEAIIESQEKNLIYEWTHILKSKNACLPVNIISSLLEWATKDLELAHFLIPILGDAGRMLTELIPEWNLLSSMHFNHPLQFDKSEFRVFAFKQFRIHNPELAFQYFLNNHEQLKESDKLKWLRILKLKSNNIEIDQLITLFESAKPLIQFELVNISLYNQDSKYFQSNKVSFLNCLKSNALNEFQFISKTKKEYIWSNAQKIKFIPLTFLEDESLQLKYNHWVETQDATSSLLEAIQLNPFLPFTNWYFNHLLKEGKLTEDFPTALLSSSLDHNSFNQCCLQWIDTSKDQLDVKAFLHFINLEKHFWSDELLAKILELRNNKVLDRKYDFTIFWQLLPYKVNPNSAYIKSIPEECRNYQSNLLNFDTIKYFRKIIRN